MSIDAFTLSPGCVRQLSFPEKVAWKSALKFSAQTVTRVGIEYKESESALIIEQAMPADDCRINSSNNTGKTGEKSKGTGDSAAIPSESEALT
jgi:hypothetical protein